MDEHELSKKSAAQLNDELLSSMRPPTLRWYLLVAGLCVVIAWGALMFGYQVMTGMSVTGKNRPVMWALYITGFVFWVGMSHFLPGGGAENSGSNAEKVYFVLSGEITVITETGEATLGPNDSCYLAAGEKRSIVNRSQSPTAMLVIMTYPPAG